MGLLPWIIAVMVFMAALAAAGVGALTSALENWRSDVVRSLTVQILPQEGGDAEAQMAAALAVLRDTPGVARAAALSEDELAALLAPWLGETALNDLPVPRLIDVELAPGAAVDLDRLRARLRAEVPGAVLDDHGRWTAQVVRLARVIEAVAFAVLALLALAGIAIVTFATRAALAAHYEIIALLHLMGARDGFIAGQFARRFLLIGVEGGVIGLGVAALALLAVLEAVRGTAGPWLPHLVPGSGSWLVLLALPVLTGLLAMSTAWLTVLWRLRRMV